MPFVPATLQAELYNAFSSMGENATADDFANGIANAVVNFAKMGVVTTTDVGGVSAGAFVGSGTQPLSANGTLQATACASIIKQACVAMESMTEGGDDFLAQEIGKGIKQMATDLVIMTNVTGMVTPPGASPAPLAGTAQGSVTCVEAPLIAALQAVYKNMYASKDTEGFDGNMELAKEMANAVNTFWASGIVNTQGQGPLAGSVGTGAIA